MTRRIAMWSGPRNISTAMMRAWGNRADTVVCDEPFYAHYLHHTGYKHHPGYDEIISSSSVNWRDVVDELQQPLPAGKAILFQKQMAQHLLDHIEREWIDDITNVFLIRDPREMLLSLVEFLPTPSLEETGLPQQVELFERVKTQTGESPAVIDARDVLSDPRQMLGRLCEQIDVEFDESMLHWKQGLHETDGVWARHWYSKVAQTTSFAAYRPRTGEIATEYHRLLRQCQELYDTLAAHKLRLSQPPSD